MAKTDLYEILYLLNQILYKNVLYTNLLRKQML